MQVCRVIVLLILVFFGSQLSATQQQNDIVEFQGKQGELALHWSYGSPLEIYFSQNKIDSPFEALTTANWRGHIATWQFDNNKLYLSNIKRPNTNVVLSEVLPDQEVIDSRIHANWYSGQLLLLTNPEEIWRTSSYSDEKYRVKEFKTYYLVDIDKGVLVNEHAYPAEHFWYVINAYRQYKSIESADIAPVARFDEQLKHQSQLYRGNKKEKPRAHTESDFDLFLTRTLAKDVRIPLSKFALVKDVELPKKYSGWFMKNEFKSRKGQHALYVEMGATNIPRGPWSDYTGGSVQAVIPIEKLVVGQLSKIKSQEIYFTNNYAEFESPQFVTAELNIIKIDNDEVVISGRIIFKSEHPQTQQVINLDNNSIPIFSMEQFQTTK